MESSIFGLHTNHILMPQMGIAFETPCAVIYTGVCRQYQHSYYIKIYPRVYTEMTQLVFEEHPKTDTNWR